MLICEFSCYDMLTKYILLPKLKNIKNNGRLPACFALDSSVLQSL